MRILFSVVSIILSLPLAVALVNSQAPKVNEGIPIAGGQLSQPTAKTRVVEKVKIAMRDDVRLVADIVLPEAGNKHPAILIRTPYGRRVDPDWVTITASSTWNFSTGFA